MAAGNVEDEIQQLMRPKSVASSMGIPTKSLYDWKIEKRFKHEEDDNRVCILSTCIENLLPEYNLHDKM